ncbi:winged helix-turn-helix transcriptional regulator [Candidatus Acetothermia bacterium]|nr:winged helix-turn-helix transcriptional regulator [Candidatus Acetothermia bacterium]MBI3660668.1 winged helix-turn-helix transcriptional regulator [Candidatus Acetothermia bacterium]
MIYAKYTYFFKALSHRSRLRLMELLAAHGEISVTRIVEAFEGTDIEDRDPTTISRNLNILKQLGLVTSRRDGQTKYYSLDMAKVHAAFDEFVDFIDSAKERHSHEITVVAGQPSP